MNKLEFEELLSNLGVFLARQELRTVHDHFDTNKDGQVGYAEFVGCLKVSLTAANSESFAFFFFFDYITDGKADLKLIQRRSRYLKS